MSQSVSRPVALMFLLALALPTTAVAQDTADLHGVVLDASGQPAAGYPMNIMTSQWGKVVMNSTKDDGSFGAEGLPPGDYELLVFSPGGSSDIPIASKKVTLAAGQKERIEIRLGSDNPGAATGSSTAGTTLGMTGVDWPTVVTAALVLATGLVIFFVMRSRRRPVE